MLKDSVSYDFVYKNKKACFVTKNTHHFHVKPSQGSDWLNRLICLLLPLKRN